MSKENNFAPTFRIFCGAVERQEEVRESTIRVLKAVESLAGIPSEPWMYQPTMQETAPFDLDEIIRLKGYGGKQRFLGWQFILFKQEAKIDLTLSFQTGFKPKTIFAIELPCGTHDVRKMVGMLGHLAQSMHATRADILGPDGVVLVSSRKADIRNPRSLTSEGITLCLDEAAQALG